MLKQTIENLPPKSAFSLGFAGGLLIVFALGFFALLAYNIKGNDIQLAKSGRAPARTAASINSAPADDPTPAPEPPRRQAGTPPPVTDRDWVRGPRDAKVTLIEYSDFECPFCNRFHPTMSQIIGEYPDDVRWVYRHFPLSFHAGAQKKAEAAECVGELGGNDAFWSFSDLIFERQPEVSALSDLAAELGLGKSDFQSCLDSGKYAQYVRDQMNAGANAGVTGTPGTFAIGPDGSSQIIPGALPLESVKSVIESLL